MMDLIRQYHLVFERFCRAVDGSVTIEAALLFTVFGLLGVGVMDGGIALTRQMQLTAAVNMGAQYAAFRPPTSGDFEALEGVMKNALPEVSYGGQRTVSTSLQCECGNGAVIDCLGTATCNDGSLRGTYVILTITETYKPFFDYPGLPETFSLSQTAKIRVS